jgi:hypothetical protein
MTDTPSTLFRLFDKEEYALRFVRGEIRFGLLTSYREAEGKRKDPSEGKVSLYWDTPAPQLSIDKRSGKIVGRTQSDQAIQSNGCCVNPYYILSTAGPSACLANLARDLGPFGVQICSPVLLLERIKAAWKEHPLALLGGVFFAPVVYDRDALMEPDPYLLGPPEPYFYAQKHRSAAGDSEFRYVLECGIDEKRKWEKHIVLKVGDCTDFCSLLEIRF